MQNHPEEPVSGQEPHGFGGRERLRSQLKRPDTINLYGGEVLSIIDLQPERLKTETPVFWLGGWGTTIQVMENNIVNLAERGRRTLAVDAPHGIESAHIAHHIEGREHAIRDVELKKVAALLKALDEKSIAQTDIVAHSEGAIYGVSAALLRPERFRNLVLVDPAGMIGEDTQDRLIKGAALDLCLQTARIYKKLFTKEGSWGLRHAYAATRGVMKAFGLSPRRTMESVGVIAGTQIHELLKTLKELGMAISIVHAIDDKFFPMEKVKRQATDDAVNGFYPIEGTHNQLYLHPEKHTALIDEILDTLEALRKTS